MMNFHIECELFDIKREEDPLSITEIKAEPQIQSLEENGYKLFEGYAKKAQDEQENSEEGTYNIVSLKTEVCDSNVSDLQEEYEVCVSEQTGENVNSLSFYNISFFENGETTMCTKKNSFRYQCKLCNKGFSDKSKFTRHIHLHSGVKPFTCDICNRSFSLKYNLITHTRTHKGEKPFTCNYCCKSFSQKVNLNNHTFTHLNVKPFTCITCEKSFPDKYSLMKHTNIHTNEQQFNCQHCNQSFSQKGALTIHTRIHTNEKPFTCSYCNKSFSQKSNLSTHISRMHTCANEKTLDCKNCNSFSDEDRVIKHTHSHTCEKQFKCNDCSKSFLQKGDLAAHTRIHTKEKPFTCVFCSKSFSQKSHLNNHVSRMHTCENEKNIRL